MRACVADGHDCAGECPFIGEPSCVTQCRIDHVECVGGVRTAFSECRAGCADELMTARMACTDDPASDACAAAKRAAYQCLDPCYEAARDGLHDCRQARRGASRPATTARSSDRRRSPVAANLGPAASCRAGAGWQKSGAAHGEQVAGRAGVMLNRALKTQFAAALRRLLRPLVRE